MGLCNEEVHDHPQGRKWVMSTINSAWKSLKCDVEWHHFSKFVSNATRLANRPTCIPDNQLKDLFKYWNSFAAKRIAEINIRNQKKQKYMHIVGKRSFARITYRLKEVEEHQSKIDLEGGENSQTRDAFDEVMGDKHPSCIRLFGRGVTQRDLKGKIQVGGVQVPKEVMESMKANIKAELTKEVVKELVSKLALVIPSLINIDLHMLQTSAEGSPGHCHSAKCCCFIRCCK